MNNGPGDPWRGQAGPPQPPAQDQRPFGGFGPNSSAQPPHHVLPPPPPYQHHPSQPAGNHALSINDLTQGPTSQHQYNTQPPPPPPPPPPPSSQSHGMGQLGQPLPQHSPQYSRDRELMERRDRELREAEFRDRERAERDRRNYEELESQRRRDQMMMLERDRQERDHREMERMRQEQSQQQPVQIHAASIPIHQPVANKTQNTIHGPNGLLANGGAGPTQPNGPVSSAPSGLFSAPVHEPQRNQFAPQALAPPSQQSAQAFLAGPSPMQSAAQLPHGQQPILNDALSYLDQVKVQFSNDPDVYNKFLDIMKDFKSQAIDTPGVIGRVSNLFTGHPGLIQGFNTFLPPGYRIECGTGDNPDTIRVTTPSGTTTQPLSGAGRGTFDTSGLRAVMNNADYRNRNRWSQPPDENAPPIHQREQDGVTSLQTAATAAANGTGRSVGAASPPPGFPGGALGADLKRGGPVEFNHAISYVNKIKNRFAQQPEIYKQFLEILQTYQRESKPIQDVYAQVTGLFNTAPDLLEDFKQFLPETAGTGKAQAAARVAANEELSNTRDDPEYSAAAIRGDATPKPPRMPPMGQFDPPSTSKDTKKRRAGGGQATVPSIEPALGQSGRAIPAQVGNSNKRQKLATQPQRMPQTEVIATSPTLVPQLPEPLPPFPSLSTTQEELGFFDRVRKQIGNRQSYTEFLKLMNLFTQDLIEKHTLYDRALSFIGNNTDLSNWLKDFLGVQDQEEYYDARARQDLGKVKLAHCRALGPSYRHLPKRDQNKTCKGRDGMCYEVLNDVWASHPTWASEDSGFVAHRKNQYEEALHRIEEERHDYDFHIESCQRTIQLMEPIVQQISTMNEVERASFQLQPTLGGASEAIPKRIIMKIYGRETGAKILTDMISKPTLVLPILLVRLKQKVEEWKAVQREWEKVWRDQINKQFWKSLDHQGINSKNLDKKNFQHKTLTTEIQAKWEEQKKLRDSGTATTKHQLEYTFGDTDVIKDASKLIWALLFSERTPLNEAETPKVRDWFVDFVCRFYGINRDDFLQSMPAEGRDYVELQDGVESDGTTGVRVKNGRGGLLRKALDRRNGKDSSTPASKESTPAPMTDNEMDVDDDVAVESESEEQTKEPWIKLETGNRDISQQQLALEEPYPHTTYNLYANANIYCFFRLFEMLYARLLAIKNNEQSVIDAVSRFTSPSGQRKAALDLRYIDKEPKDFFENPIPTGENHFYQEILRMCDDVILNPLDQPHLEETLRRFYNKTGWQLYTVDKLVSAILRFLANILGGDTKDKSVDIANLFFKDREKPDTTRKQEIQYRKQVERYSRDSEVYRISYTPDSHECTIRLFPSEEATFDSDALSEDELWRYYVASYSMRDATEGVDQAALKKVFLRRNIPAQSESTDESYGKVYGGMRHFDEQSAFVSPGSYRMFLSKDFGFERVGEKGKGGEGGEGVEGNVGEEAGRKGKRQGNKERFREVFQLNTAWMRGRETEEVEMVKGDYERGVKEGFGVEVVVTAVDGDDGEDHGQGQGRAEGDDQGTMHEAPSVEVDGGEIS